MLSKANRIKKSDFPVLIKIGQNFSSENFSLKFSPQANPNQVSLFSVVIAKKIVKTAVGRNKLKRRVHYALSKKLAKIKTGYQVIIFIRANLLKTPYSTLEQELLTLLIKTKLLHV